MYHRKPVQPGQAFSFAEPQEVFLGEDAFGRVYRRPGGFDTPELCVLATTRLLAYDACLVLGGMWRIDSWLHNNRFSFLQRCGYRELASLNESYTGMLDPADDELQRRQGWEVTNVDWPAPTPESLAVQVRVLSFCGLPFRGGRNVHRQPPPIPWRRCQHLQTVPLEEGVKLALEWLRPYAEDPVTVLGERGFAV